MYNKCEIGSLVDIWHLDSAMIDMVAFVCEFSLDLRQVETHATLNTSSFQFAAHRLSTGVLG